MKRMRLTREERDIENALIRGEYLPASKAEVNRIAAAIARRKKDAVLNIRMNSHDLRQIKAKAKRLGVPYQTFVAEFLHHLAI